METASSETKTYHPNACVSGDRYYFLGVDLKDTAADTVLRVIIDPLYGPALKLTSPQGVLRLDPASCSTLKVAIEPTGWRVNHIRVVSGAVDLDCALPDGVHVSGAVTFQHCH